MAHTFRSDTLPALAARGVKLRARDVSAHVIVCEGVDGVSEMLVGRLDAATCDHLADLAKHLLAKRMRIASPARLRTQDGSTLDVVVALDLTTRRQVVVSQSDGVRLRCGKVRHSGVEALQNALKNGSTARTNAAPQKGGGKNTFSPPTKSVRRLKGKPEARIE